ncbi:phosphoribosylformylglycinamidine cyclo-ligase [candidate division WOR-3 bacterium]|uniref:Phosphoribosylformylglycinamidine cyclo-ligase n=1 Tax=candidate division TA06 bacterium TaxID=2250710 RepID=A0A660SDG3_UNCT6|nr:phosphoribosylformylglycinamidine cyclo-ligase [candidate division WOR-3 bacterium]RKX68040.1 MAG: phosphoribosylformylglycinamidine cyclo-ligase [candidate division TA06 bacterium]HHD82580.1 phosphoribosylformylglycinamidine cyclo-ligase [Bacteroidota bacterium]
MKYKDAGVDIDEGLKFVKRIKGKVKSTFNDNVLSNIGNFGALYDGSFKEYENPVLVSSSDGVGTKIKIGIEMNMHKGLGMDIVNHCVNDIAVLGAKPLYFLDYMAFGKLKSEIAEEIVEGMVEACKNNGLALIGGETAEMPGMYNENDYDIAGFIVGVVEKSCILDGSLIQEGDIVFGIKSKSLHTNGFSLARKVLFDSGKYSYSQHIEGLKNSIGETLLTPHKSYYSEIRSIIESCSPHGFAHITGGGLYDNIERILPENTDVIINLNWEIPTIFKLIKDAGNIPDKDLYRTLNMGIGMVVFLSPDDKEKIATVNDVVEIGRVVKGNGEVIIKGVKD